MIVNFSDANAAAERVSGTMADDLAVRLSSFLANGWTGLWPTQLDF